MTSRGKKLEVKKTGGEVRDEGVSLNGGYATCMVWRRGGHEWTVEGTRAGPRDARRLGVGRRKKEGKLIKKGWKVIKKGVSL